MTNPLEATWASSQLSHPQPSEAHRKAASRLYADDVDLTHGLAVGWAVATQDLLAAMRGINPSARAHLRVDADYDSVRIFARYDRSTRHQKIQLAELVESAIGKLKHTCVFCGDTTTARRRTAADGAETICCDECLSLLLKAVANYPLRSTR